MRQSNTKYKRENTAFIYVRLSRDDNLHGDSYSISNQKKLLTKVAKEKGYTNIVVFCDDGISGVTMNRPDFNKMMEQLKLGKASALFVKDLSRLGRNYIEVGRLTDDLFPSLITFEDGCVYKIDRLKHRCRAHATKVGRTGIRYTIVINNKETYLFEDDGRWFVEVKGYLGG